MTRHVIPLGGAAASLLALAASAFADVKINENYSVSGYAAGSYKYFNEAKTDRLDLDAAKLNFLTNFSPVSAVASIYYTGGATPGDDLTLLDAYVNYDAGNGVTVTGGKFLSYLGYEAFDIPNMTQISYANGDFLGAIPAYHTGVKVGYSVDAWSAGVALLDSIYGGLKGDGELRGNAGLEAFVSYAGIEKLTIFAAIARQTEGTTTGGIPDSGSQEDVTVYNVWAGYQLSDMVSLGAEYTVKEGYFVDGYNWLLFAGFNVSEKVFIATRLSGEDIDSGPSFLKATFAPAYKLTENLSVRAEVSFYDYDDFAATKDTFVGVQGVFKF